MKEIAKVWVFASDSSDKRYETIQYADGSTSCNCPGWKFKSRGVSGGERTCKHTRMVDMGLADTSCVTSKCYQKLSVTVTANIQTVTVDDKVNRRRFIKV